MMKRKSFYANRTVMTKGVTHYIFRNNVTPFPFLYVKCIRTLTIQQSLAWLH